MWTGWPTSFTAAVAVAGFVLLRRKERGGADSQQQAHETVEHLEAVLQQLAEKLSQLRAEKETLDVYDVRLRIDGDLAANLRAFADQSETIQQAPTASSFTPKSWIGCGWRARY